MFNALEKSNSEIGGPSMDIRISTSSRFNVNLFFNFVLMQFWVLNPHVMQCSVADTNKLMLALKVVDRHDYVSA